MDRTWIVFIAGAALFSWSAGPRLAVVVLVVFEAAVALGASALEAAGTGMTLRAAADAVGAVTMFLWLMLAPSAVGVMLGWGLRRFVPPPKGRLPRMTGER
jgi:hypothetical protein